MARYGPTSSNLKGIPYLIFDGVMFMQHNPGLLMQDRKQSLYNVFAWVSAKHGKGDYKANIQRLSTAFKRAQDTYEPVDLLPHATPAKNEFMNLMDEIQYELYSLIVNLGILDEAGMGIVEDR